MIAISPQLEAMLLAQRKLNRLLVIQRELESNRVSEYAELFELNNSQITTYHTKQEAEKTQIIEDLIAIMQGYLSTLPK